MQWLCGERPLALLLMLFFVDCRVLIADCFLMRHVSLLYPAFLFGHQTLLEI